MSGFQDGSPVPMDALIANLRSAARAADADGARAFATACSQAACGMQELQLENRQLRRLLDEAEAKLGLRR